MDLVLEPMQLVLLAAFPQNILCSEIMAVLTRVVPDTFSTRSTPSVLNAIMLARNATVQAVISARAVLLTISIRTEFVYSTVLKDSFKIQI